MRRKFWPRVRRVLIYSTSLFLSSQNPPLSIYYLSFSVPLHFSAHSAHFSYLGGVNLFFACIMVRQYFAARPGSSSSAGIFLFSPHKPKFHQVSKNIEHPIIIIKGLADNADG